MAVTIDITANTSQATQAATQLSANLSSAFSGVQSQLKQMESASGQTTSKMISGLQQLSAQIRPVIFGQNELGAAFVKTGQAAGVTTKQLAGLSGVYGTTATAAKTAADGISGAAAAARTASVSVSGFGTSLKNLAAGFGLVLGVQGLASLVKGIVEAGIQMERFERTLTAATGSTSGAANAWKFITAESNRLGQSVEQMVPIFVQLTAATRNTVLEGDRTRELFSALAGAGQAVGLSTDAVAGAMLGLTQIISQNAIQLDEFRNQFASRIPGAMLETAKALKTLGVTQTGTIAEMLKGFERGRIGVADLAKAVTMALQEIQRTAPEMGNTAAAAFTQLSNAIFQLKADLAKSGLLEFLANMAQTARSLLTQIRSVTGLGGKDFLGQVGEIQGKLGELQKQRQDLLDAPLKSRSEDIRTGMVERLNQEIALQEQLLGKLQATHKTEMDAESEKARISQERRDKEAADLKAAETAAAASRQGAQDAAARARSNVGLTQERVNQEKIALDQTQAVRQQALEEYYTMAVGMTEQTAAAQLDVERRFAIMRLDLTRQSVLEDAKLQEQAAIQIRDAKIAAIKAADAAAQAASTAPGATAEAQVNANKRSAASAVEVQTVTLAAQNAIQEAVKKRTEAEAAYEKGVSGVVKGERTEQMKITEAQLQREAQLRQQALQSQESILSAETALVQAKVDGLVLTREEGMTRTQALERKALQIRRALLEEEFQEELRRLKDRVAQHTATEDEIAATQKRHAQDLEALNLQESTQVQQHQNELLQGWREWAKDVQGALGNFLSRWAEGEVHSIKDVLNNLKSYVFRLIADMIAYAATKQIIIPIVGAVLGGFGGGTGGALDTILKGVGLGHIVAGLAGRGVSGQQTPDLLQNTGVLGGAIQFLSNQFQSLGGILLTGAQGISTWVNQRIYPGIKDIGTSITTVSDALQLFGGFAGVGANLFKAFTANTVGGKVGGALGAGAAGVSVAATLGLLPAALGPIGLALAAIVPLLSEFIGGQFAPAGPRFALGRVGGLGIGGGDGGLTVTGAATSEVLRQERLKGVNTSEIQAQLAAGVTHVVQGMVDAINAVALKPGALLEPTQRALSDALGAVRDINSSNAKNMQKDIEAQLKLTSTNIASFFLRPLTDAFRQLETAELDQQISRLPDTTQGMVAVFKGMNTQLDELSKVANTDVLRQLSSVRNRVEDFGNSLADTARVISTSIVDQITDQLIAQANVLFDQPLTKQVNEFAGLMQNSLRALQSLKATQGSLQSAGLNAGGVTDQLTRLSETMVQTAAQVSTQIVSTALGNLSTRLDQVLIQPVRIQATTVNSLFNDSLAALNALWTEWHALEDAGLDAAKVREQFTRLLGGIIESALSVLNNAFTSGSFGEFLAVLASIPDEVAKLNPKLAELKALGVAFAQVVGPINQAIETMEESMRTTAERVTFTETRMGDLRDAIADAGNAADRALPLYAQLATAIQANGQAQIDAANEVADAQITAANEAADAQIQAANGAADAQIQAANEAADASVRIIQQLADAATQAVNKWADAWTTAINDAADMLIDSVNQWADSWTQAINTEADRQIAAVNEWADAWTTAINDAVDAQRNLLAIWVEDMTSAVNTWADLANTTAGQLRTVNEAILAEKSPTVQRQALLEQEAMLNAVIAAGGPGASEAMSELIRVEQQLLALAKQSNDLRGQQESINKLEAIQKALREQLVAMTGQSDPILAQIAVAAEQKRLLKEIADFNTQYSQYLTEVQQVYLDLIAKEQKDQIDAINRQRETEIQIIADLRDAYIKAINLHRDMELQAIALSRDFLLQAIDQLATAEIATINNARDAQILAINAARDAQILAINAARDAEVKAINEARDEQVKAIKVDVINQLKALEAALKTLFAGQDVVGGTLHVPVPVRMAQRGGMLAYAQGGMVPAMLEPGERIYFPPVPAGVAALNRAIPRFSRGGGFTVPGSGTGDTFLANVPGGSYALNSHASGARGYQQGGLIGREPSVVVNVDLRGATVRSQGDYLNLTQDFRNAVREALREIERRQPRRGS